MKICFWTPVYVRSEVTKHFVLPMRLPQLCCSDNFFDICLLNHIRLAIFTSARTCEVHVGLIVRQ